ncbi:MAG: WYL domain-containing protein [Anaerolineales bacterium]|nr:WYL domain-containing protein [Anaerolineales bacterium]
MRADRLLSLLMLLQARGRMTAEDLAAELEVSVRTIYRDLTALSASGVPVYTERGPGGGVGLVETYRTTLTGLTPDEARALFMVSIPAPLLQLGVGREFQTAMRKLSAALPESKRQEEFQARQRIHLDSSWWFQSGEAVPCLPAMQQAVWNDRYLRMTYRSNFGAEVEQVVAPYGLVAKANLWHLVYARRGGVRVVRVSQAVAAEMLPEGFTRPADFDLAAFWEAWCSEYELDRTTYPVQVRISPALLPHLAGDFGGRTDLLAQASPPDAEGWLTLDLPFESLPAARTRLLGLGRSVEVLAPEALRKSLVDFAEQVVAFYGRRKKP